MEEEKDESDRRKIMDICHVLQITPEQLLTGKGIEDEEEITASSLESKFTPQDIRMVEDYYGLKEGQQKRLMAYLEALKKIEELQKITRIEEDNISEKCLTLSSEFICTKQRAKVSACT